MEQDVQTTPNVNEDEIKEIAKQAAAEATQTGIVAFFKSLFNDKNEEKEKDADPVDAPEMSDELQKAFNDRFAALEKSNQELADKLAKAESDLARATATVEEKEFLAKADGFKYVAGDRTQIAKFMSFLSKSDDEKLQWFEEFLKGIDAQMAESGLYAEFGKQYSPDQEVDPIEAMVKSGEMDYREAYLKVGEDENAANKLLSSRRKEVKGG